MIKQSKYVMNNFYQTLSNGKKVFDFEKISDTKFNMFLVLTERGANGKTLNVKEHLRMKFQKSGRPQMWLSNQVNQSTKVKTDFLKDLKKKFVRNELGKESMEFWDEVEMKGNTKEGTAGAYYRGELFVAIFSINQAHLTKNSRLGYETIVLDEFNEGMNAVPDLVGKFDMIMHSAEDVVANHNSTNDVEVFIFGNFKSLNHELIYRLGLSKIDFEVTEITAGSTKLMLVISPDFSTADKIKEVEDANKNNWMFQFSKIVGTEQHSYFNKNTYDSMHSIKQYLDKETALTLLNFRLSVVHKNKYFNLYQVNKSASSKAFHIALLEKEDMGKVTYAFQSKDILENVILNRTVRDNMVRLLSRDAITFEDVMSREVFISAIKK